MAIVRKVKPGQRFTLPSGAAVVNNGSITVSLVYLNEEEANSPIKDQTCQTHKEVTNESQKKR